jgi:hypothetical protein
LQHIRIKYSVDKSEVDKSNASVQQAKTLTDNLTKSTQNLGTQGARSFKQYQAPIEETKIKMQQLRAQIDLTNRSDTKRLNDLINQYKQAKKQVDDFNKSLRDQPKIINQSKVATQGLAQSFTQMYSAIKLIVAAGLVRELVDATLEAAKLNGQVEAVGNAFRRQIPNSTVLLADLKQATRNTVGELELMQRALKFQNFGADVSKLPELLEFASIRAQQTGESIDYMVNSIVDGIGRKSYLKLDNLGISLTRLKDQFNGVALNSLSVAEVTQGVAAIVKEETAKMGGYAENTATKVDQISVSWQELRIIIAQRLTENGVLDAMNDIVEGAKIVAKAIPDFSSKFLIPGAGPMLFLKEFAAGLKEVAFETATSNAAMQRYRNLQEDISAEVKSRNDKEAESLRLTKLQVVANIDRINAINAENKSIPEREKAMSKVLELGQEVNIADAEALKISKDAVPQRKLELTILEKYNELLVEYLLGKQAANKEDITQLGLIEELEEKISTLQETINKRRSTTQISKLNAELEILKAQLSDLQRLGTGMIWDEDLKAWIDIEKIWKNIKKIDTKTVRDASDDFAKLAKSADDAALRINATVQNPLPTSGGSNTTRAEVMAKQVREAFQLAEEELTMGGIDIANNLGQSILDIELMNQEARLNNIRSFYDEQQNLAGNNSRYQAELRVKEDRETKKAQRELAISQRRARLYSIAIDTAASIAKAWVNPGWPGAIPLSAFLLAQGAVQASIVSRQPLGFKEGVIDLKGPGTTTSDSIPANLSRRESVMTANETMSSKGILMAIRSKTLDDAKLARIVGMNRGPVERQADNSNLEKYLAEISKNTSGSNWMNNTGALIEAKKEGNTTKRYNRSKFMYS